MSTDARRDDLELAALHRARLRTLARILWSAQAEGLGHIACPARNHEDGGIVVAALHALRERIAISCHERGMELDVELWSAFTREVENSVENEASALAWREHHWRPSLKCAAASSSEYPSLWDWLGTLPCKSEDAQLTWETTASFDGHLTHPCAKTRLGLDRSRTEQLSAEYGARVPLLLGALARSAASEFQTPSSGAASASAYFRARFPDAYSAFGRWLREHHGVIDAHVCDYIPLPIHPANMSHVHTDFKDMIDQGLLILPWTAATSSFDKTAVALTGAPLMSFRTLLPVGSDHVDPPYIKLPVPVQITSLRRYLSPVEANGGPLISHALQQILEKDESLSSRLRILPEECAVHVNHDSVTYERARYLSCMYRANLSTLGNDALPAGARCLPLAALFCEDPLSSKPVLDHVIDAFTSSHLAPASGALRAHTNEHTPHSHGAEEWFAGYSRVLCDVALRLWCCYGVTLELHGQNTLLSFAPNGELAFIICREIAGGAYCYEPLLVERGYNLRPELHARQDAIFESESLPLSILLHAVFCQHLLPLADAVASRFEAVTLPSLIATARASVARTLASIAAEYDDPSLSASTRALVRRMIAQTEHTLLHAKTTRAKSLLHMRALGTKSEMFTDALNPMKDGNTSDDESLMDEAGPRATGRLASFPLQWKELSEVCGASRWAAKI